MPDPSDITRFTSKRPAFIATKNASALEAMAPRPKDTTPAPSVVALTYTSWSTPRSTKFIRGHIAVFDFDLPKLDNYFVSMYASTHDLKPNMILLDRPYFQSHPDHIPSPKSLNQLHRKP